MKKVLLVTSLGAALMLGACSSKEESMDNTTSETSNTSTEWAVDGDYYTKTIKEKVILDNDNVKITLTGNLKADENDVHIEYILENKTNSAMRCFLDNTEIDGSIVDINGIAEANANTKRKDKFSLERESLLEDDLNKLSTVKGEVVTSLDMHRLDERPTVEFTLN